MFDWLTKHGTVPEPRKGMPSPRLQEDEFKRRFRAQFQDQVFDALTIEFAKLADAAWDAYRHSRAKARGPARLVCADGGNPNPTSTHGKSAEKAKALSLPAGIIRDPSQAGYSPSSSMETASESTACAMISPNGSSRCTAGKSAELERYIGYLKPYATNHDELDADDAIQQEVRDAAQTLLAAVRMKGAGQWGVADRHVTPPRDK